MEVRSHDRKVFFCGYKKTEIGGNVSPEEEKEGFKPGMKQ